MRFGVRSKAVADLEDVKTSLISVRRIMLFPDTDPTGKTYNEWYHRAKKAEWLLGHPVTVSPLLERQATPDQKKRKIDLVDYVFEK